MHHLTYDSLIINLLGSTYHLEVCQREEELKPFIIVGVLRSVTREDIPELIMNAEYEDISGPAYWTTLPEHGHVVICKAQGNATRIRLCAEWERFQLAGGGGADDHDEVCFEEAPSPIVAYCLGAPGLVTIQRLGTIVGRLMSWNRKDGRPSTWHAALAELSASLECQGFPTNLVGTTEWEPDRTTVSWETRFDFSKAFLTRMRDQANPASRGLARVVICVVAIKNKVTYIAFTRYGALSDEAVLQYNEGTNGRLRGKHEAALEVGMARAFVDTQWTMFQRPPPSIICLPCAPESHFAYLFALTKLSEAKAVSEHRYAGDHTGPDCVCPWLPSIMDRSCVCRTCRPGKQDPFNSTMQFCDHLRSTGHRRKFSNAPSAKMLAEIEQAVTAAATGSTSILRFEEIPTPPHAEDANPGKGNQGQLGWNSGGSSWSGWSWSWSSRGWDHGGSSGSSWRWSKD